MATLLVHHPVFAEHIVPPGHPERPARLSAIHAALDDPAFAGLRRELAPLGDTAVAEAVHPGAYVEAIRQSIPEAGHLRRIDSDTVMAPKSFEAALRAIGAACYAVDAVVAGAAANAFCAIRPPGHHAEPDRAMGFCLFNTAAAAARYAQRKHGAARVAIVDWDVHHGNGTQAIFWHDPSVLYASTHQMPLYPGTGAMSETGVGNIVNAPLAPADGGTEFREAFEERLLPALEAWCPDLIIISAGFDAHFRDPLAEINLVEDDFAWATEALMAIADRHSGGRIVSLLEGGYDLTGLSTSVAAHVAALMAA